MKKQIIALSVMLASALSLTNCAKEELVPVTPSEGTPFSLTASIADTKTANDGLKTTWVADDAINLFHAAAGTTTYVNDGSFTVSDVETGKFDGTLAGELTAESYNWYAFYPYSNYIKAPDGSAGYWPLGHAVTGTAYPLTATQQGNDNTAHLAGQYMPLYAVATVSASEPVSLNFKNLASVVKIIITNTVDEPLIVSSVKFTSTEDIVGTFKYDLTSEPVKYESSGTKYTGPTASLTVENGTAIAKDASASFYLPIKPHTAPNGSTLKISVNGYEKTLELKKDVTFTAGSIKPLKFDYNKEEINFAGDWLILGEKSGDHSWNLMNAISGKFYSALSTDVKGKVFGDLTIDDFASIEKVEDYVFTIAKSGTGYSIKDNKTNKYVARTSADLTTSDTEVVWNIALGAKGNVEISDPSNDGNKIYYNASSPRFKTYTNAQNPVYLIKWETKPALGNLTIEVAKSGVDAIEVTWTDVEHATEYVVSCTGQIDQTIDPSVEHAKFEGLADGDYVVTVTAKADGYRPSTATSESIHIGLASRELKFADNEKTIAPGENYTNTLTGNKVDDVVYTITNKDGSAVSEDAITIDEKSGYVLAGDVEGEYIVTATAPATAEFAADEASYTLIVKDVSTIPVLLYTLDTSLADNKGKNSSYSSSGEVTCNNITWNAIGNISINPWRIGGGKSDTITKVDRAIYTKTPYSKELTKIDLTIGAISNLTINSAKLVYSSNADFSNATEVVFTPVANGTVSISPTSGNFEANCYYKFVFNVTGTGISAKYFQFKKVEFYGFE